MAVAETIEDLTPAWFTAAFHEGGALPDEAAVVSAESEAFGVGQAASVIRTRLGYDGAGSGPASAVVKLPSLVEASRQMATGIGMYRAEVRYYEEVAPRVALASPDVYFSAFEEDSDRFTLVIEDLSGRAETGDMLRHATADQVDLAMAELVKLQVPLWDSPWLATRDWLADPTGMQMLFGAAQAGLDPFLDRFGDLLDDRQRAVVSRLAAAGPALLEPLWQPPFVVGHGDFRLDNMLFGTGGGAPPLCLIDWQMSRSAPPGIDVAVFLATCVDIEERRARERSILEAWVEGLGAGGVEGFGHDAAWERYRAGSLYPMVICVAAALTLGQNERDDRMWRQIVRGTAALVTDLEADGLAP